MKHNYNKLLMYKPTIMQRLLGRNYKWWYILQFKFAGRTVSTLDNGFFVLGHMAILISTLLVWYIANDRIIDSELQSKWTYFIIGELYINCIFMFAEYHAFDIIRGRHINHMLKPQNYFVLQFFNAYGDALLQNLIKGVLLILFIIIAILTQNITSFDITYVFIVIALAPISMLILFFLEIMVAFTGFFLNQVNGVILNFGIFSGILMGSRFPLDLLIPNFYANLFNPFGYLFFHPMQIYLGIYSPFETFYVFAGGITWCIILYFLAKFIFKLGLKRNEAVGL